jgi:Sulfatase-modifying factor enzyme 1/Bacterial SH3 domain
MRSGLKIPLRIATILVVLTIAVAGGCIKDFPGSIALENGDEGIGFGTIDQIQNAQSAHAEFVTPDGKGKIKVKTSPDGLYVLRGKPGVYLLKSYFFEPGDESEPFAINLTSPLPVELVGGKVLYFGRIYTSSLSTNVYLIDDFVRDKMQFARLFGSAEGIESSFPNDEYYALMEKHVNAEPASNSASGNSIKIGATTYLMGEVWPGDQATLADMMNVSEIPPHEVELDAFYIDKRPVTHGQYAAYARRKGIRPPASCNKGPNRFQRGQLVPGHENKPMACLSWTEARQYCRSRGNDLPTEAQWELAARGRAWGDRSYGGVGIETSGSGWWTSPTGVVMRSRSLGEWTKDRYGVRYFQDSPRQNPQGPNNGSLAVVRAGPYRFAVEPEFSTSRIGFRCAGKQREVTMSSSAPDNAPFERIEVVRKANVLNQPAVAGGVVSQVKPGQRLILLGKNAGWWHVRLSDGSEGYLFEDFAVKGE